MEVDLGRWQADERMDDGMKYRAGLAGSGQGVDLAGEDLATGEHGVAELTAPFHRVALAEPDGHPGQPAERLGLIQPPGLPGAAVDLLQSHQVRRRRHDRRRHPFEVPHGTRRHALRCCRTSPRRRSAMRGVIAKGVPLRRACRPLRGSVGEVADDVEAQPQVPLLEAGGGVASQHLVDGGGARVAEDDLEDVAAQGLGVGDVPGVEARLEVVVGGDVLDLDLVPLPRQRGG